MARLINIFAVVPKEMFRINNGLNVRLRAATVRPRGKFDLLTESGMVKPTALDPETYARPNGASMRPNTLFLRKLIKTLKGLNKIIYSVPAGLPPGAPNISAYSSIHRYEVARGASARARVPRSLLPTSCSGDECCRAQYQNHRLLDRLRKDVLQDSVASSVSSTDRNSIDILE